MPDNQLPGPRSPAEIELEAALHALAENIENERAWRVVVTALWPFALAVSFRETRGRDDLAEDIAVEAFGRIARAARLTGLLIGLRSTSAFRAYLRVLCRNEGRRMLSRERRRAESPLTPADMRSAPAAVGASVEAVEDVVLLEQTLSVLLDRLNPTDRQLLLWAAQGLELREIARRTRLTPGAVGVRLHRLRARLRNQLADNEIG